MLANLTLLEQLGFEPTELERRVLGNPSFQWLYDYLKQNGWPKIADMAAGNVCQIGWARPDSNDLQKLMAPSALRKWAEEFYGHLISVLTLVATVRRDYQPIAGAEEYDDPDKRLLTRLQYWLQDITPGFRWDMFLEDHDEAVRRAAVAKQLTGTARMVIFQIGRLSEGEQQMVRDTFVAHLQSTGVIPAKDDPDYISTLTYHLPATGCLCCVRTPYNEHRHPWVDRMLDNHRQCDAYGAIGLLDCGDAKTLKQLLPRPIQRLVHAAELTMDRRLLGINIERSTKPIAFVTIVTTDLDYPIKKHLYRTIQAAAKAEKGKERPVVLTSEGRGLDALVVACESSSGWDECGYEGIVGAIKKDAGLIAHLQSGDIQLTRFGAYEPKKSS